MTARYIKGIALMLLCSVCLCAGQLIWKLMPGMNLIYLGGGFAVFALGAAAMVLAYRYGELSVLQPLNSLTYVFSQLIGVFVFAERVSAVKLVGVAVVVAGVVVIGSNGNR
ncbi:MAG: EamA family transporter [Synergistaceae bacterium]|jgi:undecaprenyl phosphate-alpha-L-ara4N flippase subunit ArnE|nr:EamA family transporter [Synergistaceae bacterium]